MLFVERHYLRTQSASFAENFYGLKRRRTPLFETDRAKAAVGTSASDGKLRDRDIRRSLFFLVAVPYLRAKLQDYYESLGSGIDSEVMGSDMGSIPRATVAHDNWKERLRQMFKKAYPWCNISFEVWLLCYNVAYLFDRSAFYRPWLAWIGVDLRRLGPEDFRRTQVIPQQIETTPLSMLNTLQSLIRRSPRLMLDSFKILLPTAIFFVKFLEWWYSPSSPARMVSRPSTGPPIPPPKILKPHPQGIPFDRSAYGICPLCRSPIANATALPSGYVFCYRCAHSHVEEHGRCPVTLTPAHVWQLRKILV